MPRTLTAPVRNRPPQNDRHKCTLTADIKGDGSMVDLTDENALRAAGVENGSIFTCDDTVEINGKQQTCGKQWVLHYPTKFAWKPRRTAAQIAADSANGNGASAEATAQTPTDAAQEPARKSKRS